MWFFFFFLFFVCLFFFFFYVVVFFGVFVGEGEHVLLLFRLLASSLTCVSALDNFKAKRLLDILAMESRES